MKFLATFMDKGRVRLYSVISVIDNGIMIISHDIILFIPMIRN